MDKLIVQLLVCILNNLRLQRKLKERELGCPIEMVNCIVDEETVLANAKAYLARRG